MARQIIHLSSLSEITFKIMLIKKYLQPDNEYLVTIKLHQAAAKHNLVTSANELLELVIGELVKHHWNYNLEICDAFEVLKERALNVPRATRELLELGVFSS